MGTCDVSITEISGLDALARPYLVIGLEGQEFDTLDVMGRNNPGYRRDGGLKYTFHMGSLQSNLQIYVYQDVQGPNSVVGRMLMPLTDVLWPLGQVPDRAKLQAGFQKREAPYSKDYVLQFMPPSIGGDGYGDPLFLDRFSPVTANMGNMGFGRIVLNLEVTMYPQTGPLLGFYANAVMLCTKAVNQMGDRGGPQLYKNRPSQSRPITLPDDGKEAHSAEAVLRSTDFRSLMRSLERMRHSAARPSVGLIAWLRSSPTNGMMAGVLWFIFCILGFFPCSLWIVPIYAWVLLALNGFLAGRQRQEEWASWDPQKEQHVFWDDTACTAEAAAEGDLGAYILQCRKVLADTEHLMFASVACWERLRNALSFADGVASTALLAGLGVVAALLSLMLILLKIMDPGLSFLCGMYGALGLISVSRAGAPQTKSPGGPQAKPPCPPSPMWRAWALNEALACVPDDAQAAHRFVATQVQTLAARPGGQALTPGGAQAV